MSLLVATLRDQKPESLQEEKAREAETLQSKPSPTLKSYDQELSKGLYLDVRDTVGRWLEAQVVGIVKDAATNTVVQVRVHYLQWDEKWDENLSIPKDLARMAEFRLLSAGIKSSKVHEGMKVHCFVTKHNRWFVARILRIDRHQAECAFDCLSQSTGRHRTGKWW